MRPNENTSQEFLDRREITDPTELSKKLADKFFENLNVLALAQFTRTEKTVYLNNESK